MPKLLVVDDSQTIRFQVQRILANAGYEVITACDGSEALEMMEQNPQLMVLDVNMPGLDGFSVCERLKELDSQYKELPIVFLTGINSKALELLGREFGAYLKKPVVESDLLDVVKTQLQLAQ